MTVFGNMVDSLTQTKSVNTPITQEQYQQWKQQYSFDGLKDLRYGQSFCNHFNIGDNILFYSRDAEYADSYIRKLYVL
jgi:hypothetical protein